VIAGSSGKLLFANSLLARHVVRFEDASGFPLEKGSFAHPDAGITGMPGAL